MNTDKLTRLDTALNAIRTRYRVRTQGELAKIIGISQPSLSAAQNGNPRYLTESLVHKAEMLAGPPAPPVQISPAEQPPQDIVIPAATAKMYADMAESIRILSELVAAQQKGVEITTPAANG